MQFLQPGAMQGGQVRWLSRSFIVWLLIALAEVLHGALRTFCLKPVVGDLASRQIGVFTGSVIILTIAYTTVRWIGARGVLQLLGVGTLWLLLMIGFEIALGRVFDMSWERILADYLPWEGGFMVLGMGFLALSPTIATHLRSREKYAA